MKNRKPDIAFSGVGLTPEQRAFVNSVINGKGFKNPIEDKIRSLYRSVVRGIEQLNEPNLFGDDNLSLDYQDLFQMKLENLQIAIVEYWKHSNKLSGVVDSEIPELGEFDAIYATTTPPPPRKKIYGTDRTESTSPLDKNKVGCLQNIAEFYDRLVTSVNYCTARSEMNQSPDCDFAPFGSILGDSDRIISGVDRGVECGPGCCDPCTQLPCTGLEPVCFGLDGIVDHIISIRNSVGGQRGIDSALQVAYQYSLGVDRLTAEFQCLINRDDLNYCKETKYAERFALARRIANDLAQGDSNLAQIMNVMFNDRFVLKKPIAPRLILDERIRKKIEQLLRSKELSQLKYDEPDDTCGCPEYFPPDPPKLPRRRRPGLPPAPVARPRIPPPLPPPPARFKAPQLPSAIPPLVAPPPAIFISPAITDEGGPTEEEETTTLPPDGTVEDVTTESPPGNDVGDGIFESTVCCIGSIGGAGTDSSLSSHAESSIITGEFRAGCFPCCDSSGGFKLIAQQRGGKFGFCERGGLQICVCQAKRNPSNPCYTPEGVMSPPGSNLSLVGEFKKEPLPLQYVSPEDYYDAELVPT